MKLHKCEMCGKKTKRIDDHHMIPWFISHDDSDSNIIRVCRSCHRKADTAFTNLILYGKMNISEDGHKRTSRRYNKRYRLNKMLYYIKLLENTYYHDMILYNIRTCRITITHRWFYNKRRPSIGSFVNIHRRAKNAAAVKGQTTLDGRF